MDWPAQLTDGVCVGRQLHELSEGHGTRRRDRSIQPLEVGWVQQLGESRGPASGVHLQIQQWVPFLTDATAVPSLIGQGPRSVS